LCCWGVFCDGAGLVGAVEVELELGLPLLALPLLVVPLAELLVVELGAAAAPAMPAAAPPAASAPATIVAPRSFEIVIGATPPLGGGESTVLMLAAPAKQTSTRA